MRYGCLFLTLAAIGCGGSVAMHAEPVPVTGSVSVGGQPVSDVVLQFQPTAAGKPAVGQVKDGKFSTTLVPGEYAYYIAEGEDKKAYEGLPTEVREASLERQVKVSSSTSSLDLAF